MKNSNSIKKSLHLFVKEVPHPTLSQLSHTKASTFSLNSTEVLPVPTEVSISETQISGANLFCVTKLITESFNQLNLI